MTDTPIEPNDDTGEYKMKSYTVPSSIELKVDVGLEVITTDGKMYIVIPDQKPSHYPENLPCPTCDGSGTVDPITVEMVREYEASEAYQDGYRAGQTDERATSAYQDGYLAGVASTNDVAEQEPTDG